MQPVNLFGHEVANDEQGMQLALQLAKQAYAHNEVPVGTIVVHQGKVIGQGFNQPISTHDPSAHAEMVAIRQAAQTLSNYRLIGCTLYVTLEPCTMCTGLLIHSRIERLVYGATEPKAGAVCSAIQLPQQSFYNHILQIEQGILAAECSQLLSDFFAMRREQKKQQKLNSKSP